MTTAVLDTNALVSATIVPLGISAQILAAARRREFTLVTSSVIVAELFNTLSYSRIQRKYKVGPTELARLRRFLQRRALITPITVEVHGIATHPEDDLILATAASAHADYLVTGDRQLQNLGAFSNVAIVSPHDFYMLLTSGRM